MTTQFDNIFHGSNSKLGKLRLAPTGLGWKSIEDNDGQPITLAVSDMKWMHWARVARDFQLLIGRKSSDDRLSFEGFQRDDYERILNFVKQNYGIALETKETSLKGWNWGKVDVQGPNLAFLTSQKPAFLLPLDQIANSNIASRTEVSLEIAPPPAASTVQGGGKVRTRPVDELVEMRFHIPGTAGRGSDDEGDSDTNGADDITAAQAFHDMIKERAEIGEGGPGEGVVVFNEVLVLTPRGRYDVDMFVTHFRLRGKTYDYKILHTSVTRLFLLPKADDIHIQLVVGLDPPIRQGQTRYPYLVMQFTKDEEMDAELNLEAAQLEEKGLQKNYEAPAYQVVSQVFKALSDRKITKPSAFVSTSGQSVLKCNLKANQGELYFLEKGLIFIAKQPVLIDFNNVHSISFSRVGGNMASSKTFDLSVTLKTSATSGSSTSADYSFTGLGKDDAEPIKGYLVERRVRVKDTTEEELMKVDDLLSSDDDEDMAADSDSSGGGAKAKRGKAGGAGGAGAGGGGGDDLDDDESEDEDFAASSSDGGSASSSSEEDDDSDAGGDRGGSDVDMDHEDEAPKKKKGGDDGPAKKKAKKSDD